MNSELAPLVMTFCGIALFVVVVGRILWPKPVQEEGEGSIERVPNTFGSLTSPLAFSLPMSDKKFKQLKKEMVSSGNYHSNALINFLAQRNLATMACVAIVAACFTFEFFPGREIYLVAIGFSLAVFVYSIPRLVLASRAKQRARKIEYALPDALDMVSMSMDGGVPLDRSLKLVAKEFSHTHVALSQELKIIARQSETGSLQTAMGAFADRLDLPEVVAWSAMLKQSQRLGIRMVDSMRDYADRIRESRKQRAELAGQLATVKLLLPVVFCLAPPVFILLIGPAVLDFRDFVNRERKTGSELVEMANRSLDEPVRAAQNPSELSSR
ncbi:MAG: type II secretion system F family protein [Mariniblastus sp.]